MKITHFASTADRYGDMCIVDFDSYVIMIDGGRTKKDAVVLSKAFKGKRLHCFILSHWHNDHYGFIKFDLDKKKDRLLKYYGYGSAEIIKKIINVEEDKKNNIIESGLDKMIILPKIKKQNVWTKFYSSHITSDEENDNSLVTVIKYNNINYFSFGDATPDAIKNYNKEIVYLINNSPNPIIKLPHHGSLGNCSALLEKINNNGKIRYIISGLGGDYVYDTVKAVLSNVSNYLYWVAKRDSNYYGTESFRQAQQNYGNRFVYANRVIVNPDGSIRCIKEDLSR